MNSSLEAYYVDLAPLVMRYRELRLRLAIRNADAITSTLDSPDRKDGEAAVASVGASTTSWEVEGSAVRDIVKDLEKLAPPSDADEIHLSLRSALLNHASQLDQAAAQVRKTESGEESAVSRWLAAKDEVRRTQKQLQRALNRAGQLAEDTGFGRLYKWPPDED